MAMDWEGLVRSKRSTEAIAEHPESPTAGGRTIKTDGFSIGELKRLNFDME